MNIQNESLGFLIVNVNTANGALPIEGRARGGGRAPGGAPRVPPPPRGRDGDGVRPQEARCPERHR